MKKLIVLFALMGFMNFGFAQAFINMPPLNREQSKILEKGILAYMQSNPDSLDAFIYLKLKAIKEFISSPQGVTLGDSVQIFSDIPMKVVNNIERTEFNGDVLKWRKNNDMQYSMIENDERRITEQKRLLRIRKEFQCKYFLKIGLPCPN